MDEILKLLSEIRPDSNFINSDNFFEDFLLDSFDIMELTALLEEKYNIHIDICNIVPKYYKDIPSIISLIKMYGGKLDDE